MTITYTVLDSGYTRETPDVPRAPDSTTVLPGSLPAYWGGQPFWVAPVEVAPPAEGTFEYCYRITGHDEDGTRAISATVTVALRLAEPGEQDARLVTWQSRDVVLRVPVTDAATGSVTTVTAPGQSELSGSQLTCKFEVAGSLARAVYGVLSTPGFQGGARAEIVVRATFAALRTDTDDPPPEWVLDPPEPPTPDEEIPPHLRGQPKPPPSGHWVDPPPRLAHASVTVTTEQTVPLFVHCRDFGELYREERADGTSVPIGCREASSLGKIPSRRFAPAPRFDRAGRFTVWESLLQPATFLVVPEHYRVSRTATGAPDLQWLQVFDATQDNDLPCLLRARCVPDLTRADLAALNQAIRADTGIAPSALLLPTSPSTGVSGATIGSSALADGMRAVIDDAAVSLTLRVDYTEAAVTAELLRGGAVTAQLTFDTTDPELRLAATVHLDVNELAGPHPDGPVQVSGTTMHNRADTAATVVALWDTGDDDRGLVRTALDPPVQLGAGAEGPLPLGRASAQCAEATTAAGDSATIATRGVYVEDLHTAVKIRNDLDYAASKAAKVALVFTIAGVIVARVELPTEATLFEVNLVQPLLGERARFDRLVIVTPEVTDSNSVTTSRAPVTVDLRKGVILDLSELVGKPLPIT